MCRKCYEISYASGVLNETILCIAVHRHHKCLRFGYVTVYPDYALLPVHLSIPPNLPHTLEPLPTFCVEVKPKQGWVPAPDRRLPKCTFCLNQYLKVRSHSLVRVSVLEICKGTLLLCAVCFCNLCRF